MALHSTMVLRTAVAGLAFAGALAIALVPRTYSQEAAETERSEEETQQIAVAERFLTVLEKTPRRGTALDRVYGHHVEFGTLDNFLTKLRERVQAAPDDGPGWMLLGLFEAHRGEDAQAADAFRKAEELRPQDALAPYYLGQSLLLIGQPEEAVQAFERAIDRKPPRNDLLEIFQQLGRVHQRAQRPADAMKVWERLEALFPDDPRVQEQIAVTLMEEGEFKQALPRFEKLASLVEDDYRRTMFRIQAADLKIRQGEKDAGLANMEALLADLNPESWLYRDVRRRIEDIFLRGGDQDGLVKYYERWIAAHAEDVDSMARLAKFLASSARVPEASVWMEKALKLAPTRTELRKSFIDQLVDDQRYADAVKQYALLLESDPGNADFLREWGKLVIKDKDQPQEARTKEATRIWRMILESREKDAPTIAQVADLFRQANLNDEAIALYKQAVEVAPEDPQYREYLGEFYHILKRSDDALATWKEIVAGPRRTTVNVARLAEIYNSFGYLDQAVVQIAEACQLDAKDFSLQLKGAEFHARAGKFDEALTFVATAEALAANSDELDAVIKQRIEVFQSSDRLDDEIEKLAAQVTADANANADAWHLLARYFEADRRWEDATEAVENALKKDAKSIPALATSARIAEQSGDFSRAADMNRQLSDVDRRSRGDHLMNVARLEAQLGRTEEALQAGKDLIVSAPGNTENYEFYAQLCFRLGKGDEGLETLRKAVRINPTEPHLIMALGAALSEQFRTDEAIEVYWRAFEKSEELEDKVSLTTKLTELYLLSNQFEKLVERFERDRREDEKRREMTICLAQAHHTSGDYGTARQELESLLSEETRDTNLLQQLSKLCEESADVDAAIEYQRQLGAIAPGHETEFRLANLLQARGDRDEATEIFVKLTQREEDKGRLLRSLDSLLSQGSFESVLAITEPLVSEQRDDWELLYREGLAWHSLEKTDEAKARFERILSLNVPHDALGASAEEKLKQAQAKARSENIRGIRTTIPKRQSPLELLGMSSQVRSAVGLDPDRGYYSTGMNAAPRIWAPEAYGVARMAAYGWLLKIQNDAQAAAPAASSTSTDAKPSLMEDLATRAAAEDASRETIYDWLYLEQLRNNYVSVYRTSMRLAKAGGEEEQRFYLSSLRYRDLDPNTQRVRSSSQEPPKKPPLSEEEVALMLSCYENLAKLDKSDEIAASMGGQVIFSTNGQMYVNVGGTYVLVSGSAGAAGFLGIVIEELKLAGREEQANAMIEERIGKSEKVSELVSTMQLLQSQEKYDRLPELYAKWIEAGKAEIAQAPATAPGRGGSQWYTLERGAHLIVQWMGQLGPEEENAQILDIMDPALDLAVAEGQKRIAQRKANSRTPTVSQNSYNQWQLKYGKETFYSQVPYPPTNVYVDQSALMILREVFEVFKRNDVAGDLPERLRARVAKADPQAKVYEQLMLGYVLWWMEEQDDALEQLRAATEQLAEDPLMRLEMASLYEMRGDFDEALTIVESITPRDQKLVQQRELTALRLAERVGDIERARQSAERLFGLRIDNNTQLALVEQMRRLGLHDMAESILARVHRRAGNQTSSLASLMSLYQGQGKTELAQQIAHTIMRRTSLPMSSTATGRNPARYRTSDGALRTQAITVLQQTGALPSVIERLETQLAKSPESPKLYDQLIELYQSSNNRDKVQALLETAVKARPKAVALRYQLAQQLDQAGKATEACDQYLEVLKLRPDWIADDLYNVRRSFDRCQRTIELVKSFETMNLKSFQQPYYIINLASELMQDEKTAELAVNLLERIYEDLPSYRNQMIRQIYNPALWKNPRIYQLGKRGVLPTKEEVASNPWFAVGEISSYGANGHASGAFQQLLDGIQGTDNAKDLRGAIETTLAESPGWHGGEALLALMDVKDGKAEEAKTRLEKLLGDETRIKEMPAAACWLLGQELDSFEDTRSLATKLLERAVTEEQSMRQLEYSAMSRLLKLYIDTGRRADASALMLKQLNAQNFSQYDVQYSSYQRVENSIWAGEKMLELGFPVEAVRIYQSLSNDTGSMSMAAQWNGNQADYYQSQLKNGMNKAFAALDESNASDAMAQLLTVLEKRAPGIAALDLMVAVPDIAGLRTQPMQSPLVNLLQSISKQETLRASISGRLRELRAQHPDDLSIAVALAAYEVNAKAPTAIDAVRELDALVASQPLAEIPEGRRPNSRQRREALHVVPLWLVARESLASAETAELGERLGARALEAARRQVDKKYLVAILYDWGQRSIEQGNRDEAEKKWSELLELVTERPKRKAPAPDKLPAGQALPAAPRPARPTSRWTPSTLGSLALVTALYQPAPAQPPAVRRAAPQVAPAQAVPAQAAPAESVPPLTISQFRVAMEIAVVAAENNMPELSRKAVRSAMLGGLPVPDAVDETAMTAGGRLTRGVVSAYGPSGAGVGGEGTVGEVEVATAMKRVLDKWTGDAYSPPEVYDLLHPIVLPQARATEIMLFADSSNLHKAETRSLGLTLVKWAKRADRLDDLAARIESRKQNSAMIIPALVLQIQIALANEQPDAALPLVKELDAALSQGALPQNVQLACHAAIPATEHAALKDSAVSILKRAIQNQAQQAGNGDTSALGELAILVNRHFADKPEEVKAFYEQYLLARQAYYSQYSGDYGQYQQWRDYASIADAAAESGLPLIALDYIGRVMDFSYPGYSRPTVTLPLAVVCRELNRRTPEERYQAWRAWTLPQEGRQTVRLAAEWARPAVIPPVFLSEAARNEKYHTGELISNFNELIDAAEACGKLEELRDDADRARGQKLANANHLWMMTLIRMGDVATVEPILAEAISTVGERVKTVDGQSPPDTWPDYLLYRESLRTPEFAALYAPRRMELTHALRGRSVHHLLEHTEYDYAVRTREDLGATIQPGEQTLAHWKPASTVEHPQTLMKPWWVAHEGHLTHLSGSGKEILAFRYPLTGDFTFSVDCYKGGWKETDAGYGGIIVEALGYSGQTTVWSVGNQDRIEIGGAYIRHNDGFNHVDIRVKDGVMQYVVNNQLNYEEPVGTTSPWLLLYTDRPRVTAFKNLRITGDPVIPREVKLIAGDRMDGWNSSNFYEQQPPKRLMAYTPTDENDQYRYERRNIPTKFDWLAKDNQLIGEAQDLPDDAQSWIYYHRPLEDGETVRYEFHYVPGRSSAFPAIGQLAMMLFPDGVKAHWISDPTWDAALFDLPQARDVVEPEHRRGPSTLPLKENDWNQVETTIKGDTVVVSLNGTVVYERPLEPTIVRTFGIFRRRNQSSQVRELTLTGPWPETLSAAIREDLLAARPTENAADERLLQDLIGEFAQLHRATEFVAAAKTLPDAEAYVRLRDWVLPTPARDNFRLYFERRPIAASATFDDSIVSPAVELVRVAKRLGKLPELSAAIDAVSPRDANAEHGKLALASLIAIESGDAAATDALLAKLYGVIEGLPQSTSLGDRMPDYLVVWRAMQSPSHRFAAYDLATKLQSLEREGKTFSGNDDWRNQIEGLAGDAERTLTLAQSDAEHSGATFQQWHEVPYWKPDLRGKGFRPSTWRFTPGATQHLGGENYAQLYFQSPLRGKFEIHVERALHGWRDTILAYGMMAADPRHDFKAKRLIRILHGVNDVDSELNIPHADWLAQCRIVVDGSKVTTYVNDVLLHEEIMKGPADPWLVLRAFSPGFRPTLHNLRIVGEPEIPDAIDLVDTDRWQGWRADMYREAFTFGPEGLISGWSKVGEEIVARLHPDPLAKSRESLLMYQRPLLEDGVIEFESYFAPGEFAAHPALGRIAYLVRPDGVKLHRLTDLAWETTGLAPDNESLLEGAAATVPLKEKDWNQFRLEVKGDLATLFVNGAEVAKYPLEERPEERFFGLFRYSGRDKCRVRKVIYRGEWPKQLPSLADQELAYGPAGAFPLAEVTGSKQVFDLAKPLAELAAVGVMPMGPSERITAVAGGTRLELENAPDYTRWPGLIFKQPISGDFDVTLDFAKLQLAKVAEGWGTGASFKVEFDVPHHWAEVGVYIDGGGHEQLRCTFAHKRVNGSIEYDSRNWNAHYEAGRMRMIRQGGLLHCLYAPQGTDEFRLLETYAVGDVPVAQFKLENVASDAQAKVDIVAGKVTLIRPAPRTASTATGSEK
jgi:Flp pilus assembly protein TadD